jgi:hypothetical protein
VTQEQISSSGVLPRFAWFIVLVRKNCAGIAASGELANTCNMPVQDRKQGKTDPCLSGEACGLMDRFPPKCQAGDELLMCSRLFWQLIMIILNNFL